MDELNSSVLKLAREIRTGKVGIEKANKVISELENKYGCWDMPVELPDESSLSPEQYLKALSDTINAGVFSKEALIKMATLCEKEYERRKAIFRATGIIGISIFVIIVLVVIVIMINGGAK